MSEPKFKNFAKASQKGKSRISYKYVIMYILLLVLVFGYYYMNKNMAEQTAVKPVTEQLEKPATFMLKAPDTNSEQQGKTEQTGKTAEDEKNNK